jgi:hypothetical protein
MRDGDRFWYERPGMFTPNELALIYNTVRHLVWSLKREKKKENRREMM